MDSSEAKKLKFWKSGHLTDLALSCLIDDEIEGGLQIVMRHHVKKCGMCRDRMAKYMKVDHLQNPKG